MSRAIGMLMLTVLGSAVIGLVPGAHGQTESLLCDGKYCSEVLASWTEWGNEGDLGSGDGVINPKAYAQLLAGKPVARIGKPEEIAEAALGL